MFNEQEDATLSQHAKKCQGLRRVAACDPLVLFTLLIHKSSLNSSEPKINLSVSSYSCDDDDTATWRTLPPLTGACPHVSFPMLGQQSSQNISELLAMSQTPPTPPILRLPPELLERVFSFLAPCDNERYWDSVEPVPDCVIRFFTGWKHTCQAARLTCRDFSRAETLRKALFHTLYWFPTNNSLERMKSIVEKYPNLVHTFSWFGPVFGYWDPDIHSYRGQLEGEFESKKAIGGLGLSEMFTPYQRADVGAGFIAL